MTGEAVGPKYVVDWSLFFGDGPNVQPTNKIDTKLAEPLLNLPLTVVDDSSLGNNAPNRSLAVRNLKRGIAFALPAGETIAAYYGIPPLTPDEVGRGLMGGTPLWFYILKEPEVRANGERLDGVGARIVAEVFVDALCCDTSTYLVSDPGWKPFLPSAQPGDFTITDLLGMAATW